MDRLVVGAVFSSYDEFALVMDTYCQENLEVFVKKNAVTAEYFNKTIKKESNMLPTAWRYKAVQLQCKHYGTYSSRSSGSRPDTETFKCGCEAKIRLCANKSKNGLVITDVNLQHTNHPKIHCESDVMVYPESRVLTIEQKSEMYGLFGLKVPAARIVCHFETKYGLKLQSQDVHNHRMRYRKEMSDGLSEEDATCQLFQRVIERDPGATVEVI